MLPWTMAIAYRRTQQGVLIRFGRSRAVTWGTLVRLLTLGTVLGVGAWLRTPAGIVVGTSAVASAVVAEALYSRWAVAPVRRGALRAAPAVEPPLSMRAFVKFYTPLSLTPLLNFIGMPLAAGAMSRMPMALESFATWPVLSGSTFTLRSVGFAFNEVMVSLLDRPAALPPLRRFASVLGVVVTVLLLAGAVTPLAARGSIDSALAPGLASLACDALCGWCRWGRERVAGYHQGILVHSGTRSDHQSMVVLLAATGAVLAGRDVAPIPGPRRAHSPRAGCRSRGSRSGRQARARSAPH